jgi:hypothetical protein
MTTRSGRKYQNITGSDRQADDMATDLNQLLQALLEDRQAHERELAEERERRDAELRAKEEQMRDERMKREEESR